MFQKDFVMYILIRNIFYDHLVDLAISKPTSLFGNIVSNTVVFNTFITSLMLLIISIIRLFA